jgi:alcohol dehydrogenase
MGMVPVSFSRTGPAITMNTFTLKPLPAIEFGAGAVDKLPMLVKSFGRRVLVLTGGSSLERTGDKERIRLLLQKHALSTFFSTVKCEPTPAMIDSIVADQTAQQIDVVVAIGGGSVVDAGKAVSAMLPEAKPVTDYLEGVGTKQPSGKKIPFIAVPTTAGTGSEVTSNAVISKGGKDGFKKSLRHDNYIPDIALVDPLLMRQCPPLLTATCGMDTFSQLVEGYLSTKSSPVTDAIALQGIECVCRSLVTAFEQPEDIRARSDMALASLCSGVVLTNAGLGVIHGLAPPLGSFFPIPHGVVCGTLMASANDITLEKLEGQEGNDSTLQKYSQLGRLVSPDKKRSDIACREDFISFLYALTTTLEIPKLSHYNVTATDLAAIIPAASNKNNPATLSSQEIMTLLERRL